MKRILIIEDEKNIIELLKFNLEQKGFELDYELDGRKGLDLFFENTYDLVILDLMLPSLDGMEICKEIRLANKDVPIVMLTAKSSESHKVKGLNLGADDYITKPFSIKELIARIEVLFRRQNISWDHTSKKYGDLLIDLDNYKVYKKDELLDLTLKEFELLKLLVENEGRVLKREYILEKVWDYSFLVETRTLDVHIRNLRLKLGSGYIHTVRGIGYRFEMI